MVLLKWEAVEAAQAHLSQARQNGSLQLASGVSYSFAGSYQQQQSAMATLNVVIPLSLTLIFYSVVFCSLNKSVPP